MRYNLDPIPENRIGWPMKVIAYMAGASAFPIGAQLAATIGLALAAMAWWVGRALFYLVVEEAFGWEGATKSAGSIVATMAILLGGLPGGVILANYIYGITIMRGKFEKGGVQTVVGFLAFPVGAILGGVLGLYIQLVLYDAIRWMLSPGWLENLFAHNSWLDFILTLSGIWVGGYSCSLIVVIMVQQIVAYARR